MKIQMDLLFITGLVLHFEVFTYIILKLKRTASSLPLVEYSMYNFELFPKLPRMQSWYFRQTSSLLLFPLLLYLIDLYSLIILVENAA